MTKKLVLVCFALIGLNSAFGTPSRVVVIRHGEEPEEGVHLNEKGYKRAKALVNFFKKDPRVVSDLGHPVAIYAAKPLKKKSHRSYETMVPLAEDLQLEILAGFEKSENSELAQEILESPSYEGKLVVVAWQHQNIPVLAKALGAKKVPHWKDKVYDRAWVLDFGNDGVSWMDIGQRVLDGDSD